MIPISSGTYVTQADVKKDTSNLNSSTVDLTNGLELNFQFNESGFSDGYVDLCTPSYGEKLGFNQW